MYTVELRCSRKKGEREGEREGGREGELQSAPNRWRIQCCFLPRREARLLERRRRLTFDPLLLPLSLLAPPLFGHPLHKFIVFFLFARKSPSFVFTSFIGKKNIKIKLGGRGGNWEFLKGVSSLRVKNFKFQ